MARQFQFKLVLLGESAVGKSRFGSRTTPSNASAQRTTRSLVLRFVKDQFDDYRESTIGGGRPFALLLESILRNIVLSGVFDTNGDVGRPDPRQIRDLVSLLCFAQASDSSSLLSSRDTAGQERYKVQLPYRLDLTTLMKLAHISCSLWLALLLSLMSAYPLTCGNPGANVLPQCQLCCCRLRHYSDCRFMHYHRHLRTPINHSQASLDKARTWIRELQRQADPGIVIALCGNKADLAARRQVTQEEAKKYADEEGLMWAETSAKSGEGVAEIFKAIGS